MSSRVGSIADNSSGGSYAYRSSKTAVNSIFKSMAVELKKQGVVVSMLHPGFTKTNLDERVWEMKEAVEASEAAGKLWAVLKARPLEDTGKFWHREGSELPWWSACTQCTYHVSVDDVASINNHRMACDKARLRAA